MSIKQKIKSFLVGMFWVAVIVTVFGIFVLSIMSDLGFRW